MITVNDARNIVLSTAKSMGTETVAIDDAMGRVLAESVTADRDMPPFDRVTMDGIAIASADYRAGCRNFVCVARQFAGEPQISRGHEPNTCVETSTGAVLTGGCDAILPYEWLSETDGGFTVIEAHEVKPMMNVHAQGSDLQAGSVLLHPGYCIDASAIAVLASVGCTQVVVRKAPYIGIISTGDELVDVHETPLAHQIRRSNDRAIAAVIEETGARVERFHLSDSPAEISAWLEANRHRFDALVFSGGVSKGKRDYLPEALENAGIQKHFHRVAQRPGKPFWFGSGDCVVFGLPGNPVSALVGAVVYIRPWIEACLSGESATHPTGFEVALAAELTFAPQLTLFKPVTVEAKGGRILAKPIDHNGSGDFGSLVGTHGFIELQPHIDRFPAGSVVTYHPMKWKKN